MKQTNHNITAIILAAGLSRRMEGQNKLLLPFQDQTLIKTVTDKVVSTGFNDIIVITGHEKERIEESLKNCPVKIIWNPEYAQGMSTSIKAGILSSKPGTNGYMIFLADMPFITKKIIKIIIETFYSSSPRAIVVPLYKSRRGNPVLFSKVYQEELLALKGDTGGRSIVENHEDEVIEVPISDQQPISDIDTWDDYKKLNMV